MNTIKINYLLGMFLLVQLVAGQETAPAFNQKKVDEALNAHNVSSPNMASFQKVNHIATNEYTGRFNLTIPLYEISSGDIKVPITLSYNSSGVKVNDIPSNVGANWSLEAGGSVSKVVKGVEDFYYFLEQKYVLQNNILTIGSHHLTSLGWLYLNQMKNNGNFKTILGNTIPKAVPNGIFPNKVGSYSNFANVVTDNDDTKPDLFIATAPGLSSRFVHKEDRTPMELNGVGNKIKTYFGTTPNLNFFDYNDGWGRLRAINCINKIELTSPEGMFYTFSDLDVAQSANLNPTSNVYELPLLRRRGEFVYSYDQVNAYHLTRLESKDTKKNVRFEYEKYALDKAVGRASIVGTLAGSHLNVLGYKAGTTSFSYNENKFPQLNRIKRILFETGSVEFVYGLNRLDLIGDKALTDILIKDYNGKVVRKISLVYDYFESGDNCNLPTCKRLKLTKILMYGKEMADTPFYEFTYDETPMPERNSPNQDFLGYANTSKSLYNFSDGSGIPIYPKLFYAPNKRNLTMLPFSLGSEYIPLKGDYSIESNIVYSQAGILKKVKYPTGAITELDYELNRFVLGNKEIEGGGVRLKSQKIYDDIGKVQTKTYSYLLPNGKSSGLLNTIPIYGKVKAQRDPNNPPISRLLFDLYQSSRSEEELSDGSYITYSRVLVSDDTSNGYTENLFHSSANFPNIEAPLYYFNHNGVLTTPLDLNSSNHDFARFYYNNGGFDDHTADQGIFRGRLHQQNIFNASGQKVLQKDFGYTHKVFDEIDLRKVKTERDFVTRTSNENQPDPAYLIFDYIQKIDWKAERYLKTSEKTTEIQEDGSLMVTENTTTYHPDYQVVKEQKQINAPDDIITSTTFYSNEASQITGLSAPTTAALAKLVQLNILTTPIQTETKWNNVTINKQLTNYKVQTGDFVLPSSIAMAKGTDALTDGVIFHSYYANGNLQEISKKDGTPVVYIWGYQQSQPIAKIENAKFSQVSSFVTNLQNLSNADNDRTIGNTGKEGALRTALNSLRTALPQAMVTTYTYDPLVGVTSVTDPKGDVLYYVYDNKNRVSVIRDIEGKIVKQFFYNNRGQGATGIPENIGSSATTAIEVKINVGEAENFMVPIVMESNTARQFSWASLRNNPKSLHPTLYFPYPSVLHQNDWENIIFRDLPPTTDGFYTLPRPASDYNPHFRAWRKGQVFAITGLEGLNLPATSMLSWSLEVEGVKYPLPTLPELPKVFFVPSCLNGKQGKLVCDIYKNPNLMASTPGTPDYTYSSQWMPLQAGLEELANPSFTRRFRKPDNSILNNAAIQNWETVMGICKE